METEIRECEFCGELHDCEKTRLGHYFCCYGCLESYYGDDVPEDEDFISVAG